MIEVIVAYAIPARQTEITVSMNENASIAMAIRASGILEAFPEIDLAEVQVGIYSKKVKLDDLLQPGDRVEIYRPLTIDPKEARRLRARKS